VSTEAEAPTPARFVRDETTWLAYLGLAYFAYLQSVLGPLMPFLRAELALDYTTAGFHFSAFALGSVAVGLLANPIGRRWGRRVAFWAGAAGMAPGALLLVASPSPAGTVAGAALMGVLGVTLLATDQAILADGHRRWRGVALAESNVAASWPPSSRPLPSAASPARRGAGGRGGGAAAGARPPRLVLPADADPPRGGGEAGERSGPRGTAAGRLLGLLGAPVSRGRRRVVGRPLGQRVPGLGGRPAAGGRGDGDRVFFAAMVGGRILGSRLALRVPVGRLLPASLAVALAGFPLFWLGPGAVLSVVGLAVFGLGVANVYPLGLAAATAVVPDRSDVATARVAIAGGGAGLVVPLALGWLADRIGMEAAFGVAVPILGGALAAAILAPRLASATTSGAGSSS
jgi:MFS family permease